MMSYDPSSLNRNKTLLEAIEEVKKFLIANPCYKVFYANTNYVGGTTTYSKTYIDDPDSIAEYDVVFFDNNYYGKVESVGDSTFTIIGATNFKGDTGAQGTPGTPGTPGANGVSITNVSIDASNHLICTLSDGTSIDAGEIAGSTDHTITLLSASGVLTNEQYAELGYDNSIIKYSINSVPYFFRKESEDATQIVFRSIRPHSTNTRIPDIIITKAGQGYQYYDSSINVDGIAVSSSGASAGQVLTADGDGFSSWQTPSGGSFDNYVEINTTSGTFTDGEYAKLGFNDSVIVYNNGTYKTIYKKKIETTSIIEFESIDASSRQNLKLIDVNKGTKAFSSTGISMITSSTFDSGTATSGKVLTANGSGGTSWETAGGGSQLYEHNISIYPGGTPKKAFITLKIVDTDANIISSLYALGQKLNTLGYKGPNNINAVLCQCTGATTDNGAIIRVYIGVFYSTTYNDPYFCVIDTTNNVSYISSSTDSLASILDNVRTL